MAGKPLEIRLAQHGMGMSDAEITEQLKQVGDRVEAGDVILVADAAKAMVEIATPVAGVVTEIVVSVGDEPLVGDLLAVVEADE